MGRALYAGGKVGIEAPVGLPIGTMWLFTSNGTFTVPADGKYQIEIHGGGGGGGHAGNEIYDIGELVWHGGGGGGSGELLELTLTAGDIHTITIGAGGAAGASRALSGSEGKATTFGSVTVAGGKGGSGGSPSAGGYYGGPGGAASGNIATNGSAGISGYSHSGNITPSDGGQGNKNNTAQTYGDGGKGTGINYNSSTYTGITIQPTAGQPGAVIITYLGVA